MAIFKTVSPVIEPVTIAELKTYLRLEHEGENDLLSSLIRAAREEIEVSCGIALIRQNWRLTLDDMPRSGRVPLRRHPVSEITSITLFGPDGEASALNPTAYKLERSRRPEIVQFISIPSMIAMTNGMEIDFTAGFGESAVDVPDLLKRAIILLAAHWFEFRAQFSADQQPASYPAGYERLIAPWRLRRL